MSVDEDRWLAQERDYRRQVNKSYYRREEDFEDIDAYNNYLEEVEEIIEGLVNEKTRPAARARLDKLRAADPALTARNRALFDEDRVALSVAVEREKREAQQRAQQRLQQAQSLAEEQARVKAALEDEVAGGRSVTEAQAELLRRKPPALKAAAAAASMNRATNQGYSYAPTSRAQVRCSLGKAVGRIAARPCARGTNRPLAALSPQLQASQAAESRAQPLHEQKEEGPKFLLPSVLLSREAYEDVPEELEAVCRAGGHRPQACEERYGQEAFDLSGLWFQIS